MIDGPNTRPRVAFVRSEQVPVLHGDEEVAVPRRLGDLRDVSILAKKIGSNFDRMPVCSIIGREENCCLFGKSSKYPTMSQRVHLLQVDIRIGKGARLP